MCQYSGFFYREYEDEEKMDKKIDLPWRGFEPWIFEQVPAHDLNFEGD